MGTKWLQGSVFNAGFRVNRQKVIDPCCLSRAYMGVLVKNERSSMCKKLFVGVQRR
jgi:hypothetical protein